MKFIGVTSCPTGIAHSEMAAESLEDKAEEMGHEMKVEIRGSLGTENELTDEDIEEADAVIIAADISVPEERFEGMPKVDVPVQNAMTEPEDVIDKAVEAAGG
ncbi:MAG: PTS fructose transporter subunit IIB [Candidatus Nanohaloarchaea archaeon]|nr:PTS fructose transporter subunit IIB [Candidatus Nanohaloarchaea archaeon]